MKKYNLLKLVCFFTLLFLINGCFIELELTGSNKHTKIIRTDSTIVQTFSIHHPLEDSIIQSEKYYLKDEFVLGKKYYYYYSCDTCLQHLVIYDGKDRGDKTELYYYKDGKVESRYMYVNRKRDGHAVTYHSNGQLNSKGIFKKDRLDGPIESFYDNGNKRCVCNFSSGKGEGLQQKYFKNGQLYSKLQYKNGKLIEVLELYDKEGNKLDPKEFKRKFKWYLE